jgi:hypothetical protein
MFILASIQTKKSRVLENYGHPVDTITHSRSTWRYKRRGYCGAGPVKFLELSLN